MPQVSTTTPGSKINDATSKPIRTRSRFPQMSYASYNTHRFGVYQPFFIMEGVEGDNLPIRSSADVRSYTLKAPLMQCVRRNKDFFEVPLPALLPNNWEKWYTNPNLGDDVADDVGLGVENFWRTLESYTNLRHVIHPYIMSDNNTTANKLTFVFRWAVFMEMFFSNGSLISELGCHVSHRLRVWLKEGNTALNLPPKATFDAWFDELCRIVTGSYKSFTFVVDGDSKICVLQPYDLATASSGYAQSAVTLHDFLEYMREDLNVSIESVTGDTPLQATAVRLLFDNDTVGMEYYHLDENYNLGRLWSYQLACAHFYTNDSVDFIYSATLFRELIGFYVRRCNNSTSTPLYFTYNGVKYEYDFLSARYFLLVLGKFVSGNALSPAMNTEDYKCARSYMSMLFSHRRSLRYVDYFTGSRTRPLAVGDVDVNVQSNKVNVVDVTENIQKQRFLNQVARTGRKIREYLQMMGGKDPGPDMHDPLYLGHTADTIYGTETENTGVAQQTEANSITSRFTSNGSRYQFEVSVDMPCYLIGISYYDIERVYITTTDRQLHHMNRFDIFNPYMQFIGDQKLLLSELGSLRVYHGADYPFGYQLRHMEYKQRFPVASGGFINNLPGFIFDNRADDERNPANPVQNPDFIRSLPSELDRFYVSLTGYSCGSYFHFIVKDYNFCDASRPMAYAPSIL